MEVAKVNLENFEFVPPYAVKRLWRHLALRDLHAEGDAAAPPTSEEAVSAAQADLAQDEVELVKTPERAPTQNSSGGVSAAADTNLFPRDLSAASEDLSPATKRLNKAVGNVLRRTTPSKPCHASARGRGGA